MSISSASSAKLTLQADPARSELFTKRKNRNIIGTFNDKAFQMKVDFRQSPGAEAKSEGKSVDDPLPLKLFDMLGCPCIPHCGIYGDNYEPLLPLALIDLPTNDSELLRQQLPADLLRCLAYDAGAGDSLSFYFLVHPKPARLPCQHFLCDSTSELNLMYHAWAFPDIKFATADLTTLVSMGVFDAIGVKQTHQDFKVTAAGIAFGVMSQREVGMHSQRFSPCNAQLRMDEHAEEYSFLAAARHEKRCVVSFHILPGTSEREQQLTAAVEKADTLLDLANALDSIGGSFGNVAERAFNLLRPLATAAAPTT